MTSIRRVYIAVAAALVLVLLAAYCCADDYAYRVAVAEAELRLAQAGGTSPALPAPVATGPSEPVAQATASPPPAAPVSIHAVPLARGPHWTHPPDLRAHLVSGGVHQHTAAELRGLSYAELEAIHDADHNAARAAAGHWGTQRFCTSRGCVYRRVWITN